MAPATWQRYVALGDSTTEGLDDPDGAGGYRGWADRLAERLALAQGGVDYANLAVRGRTTAEIRARQLAPALALRPDLVTVVAGVNDVLRPRFDPDTVIADQAAMHTALREAGATVLTVTMPDTRRVLPAARLVAGRLEGLNAALRALCAQTGTLLLDLARHPVAGDPRLWSDDRLHANTAGHERIAAGLAHRLGVPGSDRAWADPLPTPDPQGRRERLALDLAWARQHLAPWVLRRLRGVSSGDGVTAKRPEIAPVLPGEAPHVP